MTRELIVDSTAESSRDHSVWTPVSVAGNASSVLFPVAAGPRFFRIRDE